VFCIFCYLKKIKIENKTMFYSTRRALYFLKKYFLDFIAYFRNSTYLFELLKISKKFFSLNSYPFFAFLFFAFLICGSVALWNVGIVYTFFGNFFWLILLVHGWKSFGHIVEDYTFCPELARIFLLANSAILFRIVLLFLGIL
jgi:fatty acid desaturase